MWIPTVNPNLMKAMAILLLYGFGVILRLVVLFYQSEFRWLLDNVAISTPLNAWKRITEGIYLYRRNVSPYSGNVYHETPLLLIVFDHLTRYCEGLVPGVFVICELLTACTLSKTATQFGIALLSEQKQMKIGSNVDKMRLDPSRVAHWSSHVAVAYLLHPYSILSCGAMTTTVISNLILTLSVYFTMKGYTMLMCVFLALATYQNVYPFMFILPCMLYVAQKNRTSKKGVVCAVAYMTGIFVVVLGVLLILSFSFLKSWNFLQAVYGCILNVDDLTPNIGLFWYFFTEMFDHFRDFFIYTFQINAFIYIIPLMIRFRHDSVLVIFTLHGLMCIFKSYPSVGDVALYTSLMPVWSHLYSLMRQTFIITCFFLTCSVLGPVLFNLWIYYGSANANFFFGTTLAFNAAQIFLITDVLFAYVKYNYHLSHGSAPTLDGQLGKLILK